MIYNIGNLKVTDYISVNNTVIQQIRTIRCHSKI